MTSIPHSLAKLALARMSFVNITINGRQPFDVLLDYIRQQEANDSAADRVLSADCTGSGPAGEPGQQGAADAKGCVAIIASGVGRAELFAKRERTAAAAMRMADVVESQVGSYAVPGTQRYEQARKFIEEARALARRWRESLQMPKQAAQKCAAAVAVLRVNP